MYTITPQPDLQCLLWTFAAEMKRMNVSTTPNGTNGIHISQDDVLGLHRSVLRTLCCLLEYCYEKEFVNVGDTIKAGAAQPRPALSNTDGIKKMFNTWKIALAI